MILSLSRPQDDPGREDEYRFMVVKEVPDCVFGGTTLYARHDAYGDSQFCAVELTLERNASTGEPEVAINFADGETLCSGVVDLAARTIVGNVRQLEAGEEGTGEEGFEYPSDEVTHTFRLLRVDAEATVDLQVRSLRRSFEPLRTYVFGHPTHAVWYALLRIHTWWKVI